MSNKEEFKFFIEQLHNNAINDFRATEQYKLLQEKLDKMDSDCDTMLTKNEKEFTIECFELLSEVNAYEEHHVYRKGMLDGIKILKWLEVIK